MWKNALPCALLSCEKTRYHVPRCHVSTPVEKRTAPVPHSQKNCYQECCKEGSAMTTETYSFARYLNVRSAYSPSFSPDGQYLSFLTDITGVAEVWRVPVDVHAPQPVWPAQLTFRNERVAEASYSPVEDLLLLTADVGGSELTQLYILNGDGST